MLYCSFGNGLRLTKDESYKKVLLQGSKSLSTRYRPMVGCIRSWDWNKKVWQYPVIIDNMMNLEMLMWASKNSDNPEFSKIARSHADVTMKITSVLIIVVIMLCHTIRLQDCRKRKIHVKVILMNHLGPEGRRGHFMAIQ